MHPSMNPPQWNCSDPNTPAVEDNEEATTYSLNQLIRGLLHPETREDSLQLLREHQKRMKPSELGPLLWNSRLCIFMLLQEICSVYRHISTSKLTEREVNKAYNALHLLQDVAAHPQTKMLFIASNIHFYIYPFLSTTYKDTLHERLRSAAIGDVAQLVKDDDGSQALPALLDSGVVPLCLRCIEVGDTPTQTVATFVIFRILSNEVGLSYLGSFQERCCVIGVGLSSMVEKLVREGKLHQQPSKRLLKYIIACCHKLLQNPSAYAGSVLWFPRKLRDPAIRNLLRDDKSSLERLHQLLRYAPKQSCKN